MERVLILGGSYFIGRAIAEDLVAQGFRVTLLNRGSRLVENTEQIICDRDREEELKEVLKGQEFHYLVDVSGLNGKQVEDLCKAVNLDTLKGAVFISSSAVYDVEHLSGSFEEGDRKKKNRYWGEYGTNKIDAEQAYEKCFESKGIPLTILRPPYVYGEHNYVQRESFVFEHILMARPVLLPSKNQKLQFIYAGDLAVIVREMLKKNHSSTKIYNVGNRECVTAKEWVQFCAAAMGRPVEMVTFDYERAGVGVREFFPFHDYDNVLCVDKIKEICPMETPLQQGLENAFQWYKKERDGIAMKEGVRKKEVEILAMLNL